MSIKRKTNLDPNKPGIPLDTSALYQKSREFQKSNVNPNEMPGSLAGTGIPHERPTAEPILPFQEPEEEPEQPQQAKVQAVPQMFSSQQGQKQEHPLLSQLKTEMGLEKIKCKDIELGGHVWTFRPMNFGDWEWMSSRIYTDDRGVATLPSMTVTNVSGRLAAVDGVPTHELMSLEVKNRFIPDPLNPPNDIRRAGADALLDWFRNEVGLWEIVTELETKFDVLFEEQRSSSYGPLWDSLATNYSHLLVGQKALEKSLKEDQSGQIGAEPVST